MIFSFVFALFIIEMRSTISAWIETKHGATVMS